MLRGLLVVAGAVALTRAARPAARRLDELVDAHQAAYRPHRDRVER